MGRPVLCVEPGADACARSFADAEACTGLACRDDTGVSRDAVDVIAMTENLLSRWMVKRRGAGLVHYASDMRF
jgi:hypothetical protein